MSRFDEGNLSISLKKTSQVQLYYKLNEKPYDHY